MVVTCGNGVETVLDHFFAVGVVLHFLLFFGQMCDRYLRFLNVILGLLAMMYISPDYASLHPGYGAEILTFCFSYLFFDVMWLIVAYGLV